uniref:Eosinophil differentiation factor n=1 Tax=Chrysemys picta bellii TaxID=8478 RepID=A0A8C3HJ34_CHRPI
MTLNVYFLLLALSVYAAADKIMIAREILISTKNIKHVMKDDQIVDCASTIIDGIEYLEKQPEMGKFSTFFLNFKMLKPSLQKNMKTQVARCDTENVTVSKFINKLEHLIRTQFLRANH